MLSYAPSKDSDLSFSYNKKNYEKLEQQVSKLQIEITKKDKEISILQSELQIFKKSTNNTSSQFPLPSEFKKQWLNLIQTSIMDSFDTIYSNNILLSITVQRSIQLIYDQTQKFIHNKIVFLLNCLGIVERNEEIINLFFLKFKKILLQDYYKTIFCCNDEFIKSTIEIIRGSLVSNNSDNNDKDNHIGYTLTHKDKEDINRDLNSNAMINFIEEAFKLCLYMGLHDPPLSLNIKNKPEYFYYSKSEYINIEGFAKDNSPCLMILYPPIIKVNSVFNGIKAAVYACETVTEEIIRQCEENKKNQKIRTKKTSKALSDGEAKYSSNASNEGCFELNSPIDYNAIGESNTCPYKKNINTNTNSNVNKDLLASNSTCMNIRTFNANVDNTRHKTDKDNYNSSIGNKDKSMSNSNNQISMFDVNEGNASFKLTMPSGQSKNDKSNLNINLNSANTNVTNIQRSKSLNKAYPNVITKHLQKLLPNNYKIQKDDVAIKSQMTSNILTFNKTKIKENILKNAKNLISVSSKDKGDKSSISSAIATEKPKETNSNIINKSNSPNHIIDKSRNNAQNEHASSNSNSNVNANKGKYDIIKASDTNPFSTEKKKQSTNSPTLNYLRTPIPKRKEFNTDNRESSSRRDTQSKYSANNILHTKKVNDVLSYNIASSHNTTTTNNNNNDKKLMDKESVGHILNTSHSIIDSNGNYLQTSIKKTKTQNEHSYLSKMISDTSSNYQLNYNQANVNKIVNDGKSSNSLMRYDSKGSDQRKENISNSNSTSNLMRTNSHPEETNTYYGHTLNRNDSSMNSLLMNNSDNSQTSFNNGHSSNQINKTNNLFPDNSNSNSRKSILNNNYNHNNNNVNNTNSNKDINCKLEYNSANQPKSISKNSPTIIFNAGKKIKQVTSTSSQAIKTESNTTNSNKSTIPTVKGPNSNRVTNFCNSRGFMVTNDFKFSHGGKKNDYPIQKKASLGFACSNQRKYDVQLNYDISLYQFQTMDMHSPSFRTEKDKNIGSTSQYSSNKGNNCATVALASTLGNNTTCTENQNLTTKYTLNDGGSSCGGYENYYLNGMKQKKYVGEVNNNQLGVKIETSFGMKK